MPFAEVHSFCALASAIDERDMTADATLWMRQFERDCLRPSSKFRVERLSER